MSESRVAIIGSGIVGTTIAFQLTAEGHEVVIFEKGPGYPFPHTQQFQENTVYFYDNPNYTLSPDLKGSTTDGIPFSLEGERFMRVGGSATAWEGISIRMMPTDFQTRTLFGYGDDWAITYDELEPYYGQAEALIGVSGTDDDNPFAPPRSTPFPMGHFPLAYDDQIMQSRLAEAGITLHSTPQARTRETYGDRPGCQNFGICRFCPIGARYSPNYHLSKAIDTGLCTVMTNTTVRRIMPDANGGGVIVYRDENSADDQEHRADIIIVAAGAVESARLLLLSTDATHPDGLGNAGGWVGRGLAFHHVWEGRLYYDEPLYPFRFGGWTGQSLQFVDAPTRGDHSAVKVEFSSRKAYAPPHNWDTAQNPQTALAPLLGWRQMILQAEVPSSDEKYVALSGELDRYGDPFAHVHYGFTDFDTATYDFARAVFDQFVSATRPSRSEFAPVDWWNSGSHHMGTCRMGTSAADSVVDSFGQIHDVPGIFVVGGSNFVGTSGASNPTLTMVALALRTSELLLERL